MDKEEKVGCLFLFLLICAGIGIVIMFPCSFILAVIATPILATQQDNIYHIFSFICLILGLIGIAVSLTCVFTLMGCRQWLATKLQKKEEVI